MCFNICVHTNLPQRTIERAVRLEEQDPDLLAAVRAALDVQMRTRRLHQAITRSDREGLLHLALASYKDSSIACDAPAPPWIRTKHLNSVQQRQRQLAKRVGQVFALVVGPRADKFPARPARCGESGGHEHEENPFDAEASPAAAAPDASLSVYEMKRLANIAQNDYLLQALGLK